jgi:ribosomal protein S18 acetylase RimI-like enzyme
MSIIRKATLKDVEQIYNLYKIVAKHNPGNLTQEEDEITTYYVEKMVKNGLERGLILVTEREGQIIGYFKAFTSEFRNMAHILSDLTLMIHPNYQKIGYGSMLFKKSLEEITKNMRHIYQTEFTTGMQNILFYKKFGFEIAIEYEDIENNKVAVLMTQKNINFSQEKLNEYQRYLANLRQNKINTYKIHSKENQINQNINFLPSSYNYNFTNIVDNIS